MIMIMTIIVSKIRKEIRKLANIRDEYFIIAEDEHRLPNLYFFRFYANF